MKEFTDKVEIENLYRHILKLEGLKHPISNPEGLERGAQYIIGELEKYGYTVEKQEFSLSGFDTPFYNINAYFDKEKGSYLITSHYDTVINTPGADDSASAVSIMLESARILAEHPQREKFRFISFTLEEGNPIHEKKAIDVGQSLGLIDDKFRFTTSRMKARIQLMWQTFIEMRRTGSKDIMNDTKSKLAEQITENEVKYLEARFGGLGTQSQSTLDNLQGFGLMGSQYAALLANANNEPISAIINFETIGYTNKRQHSQTLPAAIDTEQLKTFGIDDITVGDFAMVISDVNSEFVGSAFFKGAKNIDLHTSWLHVPYDYPVISQHLPDLLRSDHAPYWKQNIPAILVTDTANFRNPFYHTAGDTIDTLDFEFMQKVCKAGIIAILNLINLQQ